MTAVAPAAATRRAARGETTVRSLSASLSHDGTMWMIAGSLIAGVGAYAFQILGARAMGTVGYAAISVLWTVQYLLSSVVLTALESYVVRSVITAGGRVDALRRSARTVGAALAALAIALGLTAVLLRHQFFPGHGELALVVPVLVACYGFFVVVRGVHAARSRFKAYGGVTALESLVRLALAGIVVVTVSRPEILAWTLPAGALGAAAWGVAVRPRHDRIQPMQVQEPQAAAGRFLLLTTVPNAIAQSLLAGGPLLLILMGGSAADVTLLFVTVTAARVPLVIVQGGLLSRLLPPVTRMAREDPARVTTTGHRLAAATVSTGLVAGVAGWVVGPALMAGMFGADVRPRSALVAAVAAGVVLATGAVLLNQMLIGCDREGALLRPWVAALVCAAATAAAWPGAPLERVTASFVAGEIVAVGLLTRAMRSAGRPAEVRA